MLHKVVCVTLPGMAPFEFGVLCEVFGIDRTDHGGPTFEFHVTAAEPGPIRTKLGFDIIVHEDLSAAADADLIAIPAYQAGTDIHPDILRVIREAEARGAWVLSVCTGAFVLGEAGIL
ncbi:MAG: AraC family transcriptional regulator, partial [Cryobacterium sp.]|nr:AraC family transcriptional regulator [Cryobacterium sp.]